MQPAYLPEPEPVCYCQPDCCADPNAEPDAGSDCCPDADTHAFAHADAFTLTDIDPLALSEPHA